jgi:hypothetical protein
MEKVNNQLQETQKLENKLEDSVSFIIKHPKLPELIRHVKPLLEPHGIERLEKDVMQKLSQISSFKDKVKYLETTTEKYENKYLLYYAQKVAEFLPEPYKTQKLTEIMEKAQYLKEIFEDCMVRGWVYYAQIVAGFLPEPDRTKALINVVKEWIKEGELNFALDTVKLLPEPYKTLELIKFTKICIEKGWLRWAQYLAQFLPEAYRTKKFEKILTKYLKEKLPEEEKQAEEIAELLQQNRILGLKKIVEINLEKTDLEWAKFAAQLLPEPYRTEELIKIIEKGIKSGLKNENFVNTKEAAELLQEPYKTIALINILAACLHNNASESDIMLFEFLKLASIKTLKELEEKWENDKDVAMTLKKLRYIIISAREYEPRRKYDVENEHSAREFMRVLSEYKAHNLEKLKEFQIR